MKLKSNPYYDIDVRAGNCFVLEDYADVIVLSKKQAAELLPILEHFVKTGELPE